MSNPFKQKLVCGIVVAFMLLQGCTIASHDDKNKYWVMQPGMQKLPAVSVTAKNPGYISYPLLISRKNLFDGVTTCNGVVPVEIGVEISGEPASNVFLALSWLFVSGSSAFLIPYRADNVRHADFIVSINGKEVKRFRYDDRKYTWIASLGMFAGALSQKHDEYYVEELMADQFVNSFIIDLHKDNDLLKKIRSATR
jgi:hypothetical protein